MTQIELINAKRDVNTKVTNLKIWLTNKERDEYIKYIENGGNARSAKDKVLDELKSNDPEWVKAETGLKHLQVTYTYLNDCINLLLADPTNTDWLQEVDYEGTC